MQAEYFEEIARRINVDEVTAAVASTVSVDSANASDLATAIALVNELKADVNTLVTDLNAATTQLNATLTAMKNSGVMSS